MARAWCSKIWFLRCLCIWRWRQPWSAPGRRVEKPSGHGYAQDEVCSSLKYLGIGTRATSVYPCRERTSMAASSTLVTPMTHLSSSPR